MSDCMKLTRRRLLTQSVTGIAALATLFDREAQAKATGGLPGFPNFPPKAKRVIYLFQSGGPSQMELFDYKPALVQTQGTELPESIRMGQRLTGMSSQQASFPIVPSKFKFAQYGKNGAWVSELLPHTAKIVDDLTIVKKRSYRSDQPRPGSYDDADRRATRRPSQHGRVDLLRHRSGDGKSARIRGDDIVRIEGGQASRSSIACGAAGFCPASIRA